LHARKKRSEDKDGLYQRREVTQAANAGNRWLLPRDVDYNVLYTVRLKKNYHGEYCFFSETIKLFFTKFSVTFRKFCLAYRTNIMTFY